MSRAGIAVVAVLALGLTACAGPSEPNNDPEDGLPAKPATLTINDWGGKYGELALKYRLEPFEKATGIRVEVAQDFTPLTKLQAQKNNPAYDVVMLGATDLVAGEAQGLLSPIDTSLLSRIDQLHDQAISKHGIVVDWGAHGIAYNTELIQTAPTSWRDLLKPEHADELLVWTPGIEPMLAVMSMLVKEDTGSWPESVADFDAILAQAGPAFKSAVIATSWADVETAFANERAAIGMANSGRTATMRASGIPLEFVFPEEGSPPVLSYAAVTTTEDNYWAHQLIDYMLDVDAQVGFAEGGFYGPTNKTVELNDEVSASVIDSEEDVSKLLMDLPDDVFAALMSEFIEAFNSSVQ